MKFVIARQELNGLISKANNIVANKGTIPILSNFLIEASNDELTLTATDLTAGIRCYAKAKVLEEGATTVPARCFAPLMRELTSHHVEISSNDNDVIDIVADTSAFKMHGMNKSEFPSLPDFADSTHFKVKHDALKEALFRTSFAVSREDNRYILMGVCMKIADGTMTFTGTDGRRLARVYATIDIDKAFAREYVLPIKAVEEINKCFETSDEQDLNVYLMDDKVAFEGNRVTFITKLISGDYPELDRVIPEGSDVVVNLHREELMTLLRQISLFTAHTTCSVRFTFCDGELKITANTMDVGEGKVSMPVNYQGPQLDIAFNPGFFLDILRHSKQEIISMGLTDSFNPGIVTDGEMPATMTSLPNPLFVLMPMRLNEE